jgi:hypothetical protein
MVESAGSALERIRNTLQKEAQALGLSYDRLLCDLSQECPKIPISAFGKDLSCLETIVKFLKEHKGMNYKKIALLLNRNYAPIALTYRNSRRKHPGSLSIKPGLSIPVEVVSDKKHSILEAVCLYLRDKEKMRYSQIARALVRDDRTVWTACRRGEEK